MNSETQLRKWRKAWADAVNQTLDAHQIDARVDHRSFADQGRLEQPTIHEGYHARDMEKRGFPSDRCEINRQIRKDNRLLRELKKQVVKLTSAVMDNIRSIADALEKLRGTMILLQYHLLHNRSQASSAREWIDYVTPVLAKYKNLTKKIKEKRAEKKTLATEKKALSLLQPVRYSSSYSMYGVLIMFLSGILGYLLVKNDYPTAPMLLSFVLAKLLESNMRKAFIISGGSLGIFFTRPITCVLMLIFLAFICTPVVKAVLKKARASK